MQRKWGAYLERDLRIAKAREEGHIVNGKPRNPTPATTILPAAAAAAIIIVRESSSFNYIFKEKEPRGQSSEVGFSTTSNRAATRNIERERERKRGRKRGVCYESERTHLTHPLKEIVVVHYTISWWKSSHISTYTCPTCSLSLSLSLSIYIYIYIYIYISYSVFSILHLHFIFWGLLLVYCSIVTCDFETSLPLSCPMCHTYSR